MIQRTILLADDDALVRDGLKVLIELQQDMKVVASASDGQQALREARRVRPELALLDIRMPVMDGIECCIQLKQELPDTCILLLTTFQDDDVIRRAMLAGADGYLLKHQPSAVMIEGIRAVLHGNVILEPSVARSLASSSYTSGAVSRAAAAAGISEREFEVLQLIAEGLSNHEIAERMYLSSGTIRNYVSSLLEKLALRDRTQLAVWYYQQR